MEFTYSGFLLILFATYIGLDIESKQHCTALWIFGNRNRSRIMISDTTHQCAAYGDDHGSFQIQVNDDYNVYAFHVLGNESYFEQLIYRCAGARSRSEPTKHIIMWPADVNPNGKGSTPWQDLISTWLSWDSQIYILSKTPDGLYMCHEIYGFNWRTFQNHLVSFRLEPHEHIIRKIISMLSSVPHTRDNFLGLEVKFVGENDTDYASELSYAVTHDGELVFSSGLFVDLIWTLQKTLNFSIKPVMGKGWITQLPNGSLAGIGQQVLNGEADLSATFSQLTEYRLKHLYFLHPTFAGKDYSFFRQPTYFPNNILLEPFQASLWLVLGLTWTIIALAQKVVLQFRTRNNIICQLLSSTESLTLVAGGISQMGIWNWYKEDMPTRIIQFCGVLMSAVLYIIYGATLVSFLTLTRDQIKTFDDLVRHNYIFLTTPRVSLLRLYVSDVKLAEHLINVSTEHYVNEPDSVLKMMASDQAYAYINTMDTFYLYAVQQNFTDHQICQKMHKVSSGAHRNKCGLFLKRGSQLKETFNVKILLTVERGLNFRSIEQYTRKESPGCGTKKSRSREVNLEDVSLATTILICGAFSSVLIIILELSTNRMTSSFSTVHFLS